MGTPLQKFLVTLLLLFLSGWALLTTFGYFGGIIIPLVSAAIIAFLLDYPVAWLEKWLSRVWAALVVYGVGALLVSVLFLILGPLVVEQIQQLAIGAPKLVQSGGEQLLGVTKWLGQRGIRIDLAQVQTEILNQVSQRVQGVAEGAIGFTFNTLVILLEVILIVVMTFYMLLDGKKVWAWLLRLLPQGLREPLSTSLQFNLRVFFVGQLVLGTFMAVILTPIFWFIGVPFALLAGLFIGLMELIPFIGATIGIVSVVLLTALQDPALSLQVLLVSVVIQQVKDNILAPRLLGSFTGLSPLLIFAALLLGAKLGGFLGVVLAIPLAGVTKGVLDALAPAKPSTEVTS